MNNRQIQDLTFRLSHALDRNYDVVNMGAVLSVISSLEGTTITKEQLEATRLAKYVNQLRRRTSSEQLARRAKSLLKRWREMVGIQQQTTETHSNQNTPIVGRMKQEYVILTTPPSPAVDNSSIEQVNGVDNNSYEQGLSFMVKPRTGDFLYSSSSNPAEVTSTLTENASIKKKSAIRGTSSTVPTLSVPAIGSSEIIQKQPTSFANLLTGIDKVSVGNVGDILGSPSSQICKKFKDWYHAENIAGASNNKAVADTPPKSAADFSHADNSRNQLPISNLAPIVIDIQDSNSSSNPAFTANLTTGHCYASDICTSKVKRSKKKKKPKDRQNQPQSALDLCSAEGNVSNVINESYSCQRPPVEPEYDKFDENSRLKYPISGASEILSLSNSSMSSVFPSSAAVGASAASALRKAQSSAGGSNNQMDPEALSTCDLTFTGKFKHHDTATSSDMFGFTGTPTGSTLPPEEIATTPPPSKEPPQANTFVPFNRSGSTSYDNTSTSRAFPFDVVDVNKDKSQSKIIDELRQQNKKQPTSYVYNTTQPQLQSRQNPRVISNSPSQIFTSTVSGSNNMRQQNRDSTVPNKERSPKKRGRKKGSKGVDSVIAKETTLSSQMLMSSLGCKKVKTTKELYAEIQNRKFGASSSTSSPTLSNWLQHQQLSHISRPNSSCSESYLHSPHTSDACSTNATISTVATRSTPDKATLSNSMQEVFCESESDTNTSNLTHDSQAAQDHLERIPSTDSASTSYPVSKSNAFTLATSAHSVDSIGNQIKELLTQFSPVSAIAKIEEDCASDVFQCTCKVVENDPTIINPIQNQQEHHGSDALLFSPLNKFEVEFENEQHKIDPIIIQPHSVPSHQKQMNKDVELTPPTIPRPPTKLKKSIFDLDFDDEEDPLHQIRAEIATMPVEDNVIQVIKAEPEFVQNEDKSDIVRENISQPPPNLKTQATVRIIEENSAHPDIHFPTYSVVEDPHCVAKERYEVQTQKITEFHITALHNCYIPNVNGNWDNAEISKTYFSEIKGRNFTKANLVDFLASYSSNISQNIVPQYGSLITEFIPKDLSHVHLSSEYKLKEKKRTSGVLRDVWPFLGVAKKRRRVKKLQKNPQVKCRVHRNCHKAKLTTSDKVERELLIEAHSMLKEIEEYNLSNSNCNGDHMYIKCEGEKSIDIEKSDLEIAHTQKCVSDDQNERVGQNSDTSCSTGSDAPVTCSKSLESNTNIQKTNHNSDFFDIVADIGSDHTFENVTGNDSDRSFLANKKVPACSGVGKENSQEGLNENASSDQFSQSRNNSIAKSECEVTANFPKEELISKSEPCSTYDNQVDVHYNSISSSRQSQNIKYLKFQCHRINEIRTESRSQFRRSLVPNHKSYRKRRHKNTENFNKNKDMSCILKRTKVTIDDVGKARSISVDSNNNSSDEDVVKFDGSLRSRSSIEIVDGMNEASKEDFSDSYEDEKDSGKDYTSDGDYHEVVTRNISASSDGNNHIVLTIKKTPSKMSSPSNSLPTISSNKVPVDETTSYIAERVSASEISMNGAVCGSEKLAILGSEGSDNPDDVVSSNEKDKGAIIVNVENNDVVNSVFEQGKNQAKTNISNNNLDMSIASSNAITTSSPTHLLINRRSPLRARRKSTKCKLRHQLFFPHELDTNISGINIRIMNSVSCSSDTDGVSDNSYDSNNFVLQSNEFEHKYLPEDLKTPPNDYLSEYSSEESWSNSSPCSTLHDSNVESEDEVVDTIRDNVVKSEPQTDEEWENTASKITTEHKYMIFNRNSEGSAPKNNKLLHSFNNIYLPPRNFEQNQRFCTINIKDECTNTEFGNIKTVDLPLRNDHEEENQQIANENCDALSNFYANHTNSKLGNRRSSLEKICENSSNKSGSDSKHLEDSGKAYVKKDFDNKSSDTQTTMADLSWEPHLSPHKEYRIGLRAVDEDVNDDDGNNCARIQQFKEWHQVLQLRSYNNELLTVLPYVVLE